MKEEGIIRTIRNRRSIRRFLEKPVENEKLEKILEAARWAPSACNQQLWNFILIKEESTKKKLVKEAGTSSLVLKAPLVIVVTYREDNLMEGVQSASAAVQNMLLMATELEVGSLWLNSIGSEKKIKEILNIPKNQTIICFVLFGYAAEQIKKSPPRRDIKEITHKEYFRKKREKKYAFEPSKWNLSEIAEYQKYYCRKTSLGTEMDVISTWEKCLVKKLLKETCRGEVLDLFSYDGSLLSLFPCQKINVVELTDQTLLYTKCATEKLVEGRLYHEDWESNPMDTITLLFKLERLPQNIWDNLFERIYKTLKKRGKLLIVYREKFPFHVFLYGILKIKFADDVRKSGLPSFFGPYAPLSNKNISKILKRKNFRVDAKRYFLFPPLIEEIYQLYLQYKVSNGSVFLHRVKRENYFSKVIEKFFKKQEIKESKLGSVTVIKASR
jgi:nitroreductase